MFFGKNQTISNLPKNASTHYPEKDVFPLSCQIRQGETFQAMFGENR